MHVNEYRAKEDASLKQRYSMCIHDVLASERYFSSEWAEWVSQNLKHRWCATAQVHNGITKVCYSFEDEKEAILFSLVWCEHD